jgi:hypothetical protein
MNKLNRFVFVREEISFHPQDVTVINSTSRFWKELHVWHWNIHVRFKINK